MVANFMRLFLFFMTMAFQMRAHATALGDTVAASSMVKSMALPGQSVQIKAMSSSLGSAYSIKIVTDDARIMKEFINADGVVFAVSWQGIGRPDFEQIFGTYYSEYQTQLQSKPRGMNRSHFRAESSKLVINNTSHGLQMRGIAYLPTLLPPGLAAEDLK